ncbi:MAG: 1-acyl-sn-glycerol-3-phosphate acyltransferase [Clostridiales bacterium]|nr:1-acyl-sn-glycerol-3-phosphate acyltransferase [Clostridiales bacterium]
MIIGGTKTKVIENIKQAVAEGRYNSKVEVDDPDLSQQERVDSVKQYVKKKNSLGYRFCNVCARALVDTATRILNRRTKIIGIENIKGMKCGAIVTSNHFNPLDNTAVRVTMNKAGYKRLYMVSQDTNLAMPGWIGFIMNHEDIIPIMTSKNYPGDYFGKMIENTLKKNNAILIYPEQEMWFNYRKPRPPKRGAYYYAAKYRVPIISCFVEVRDMKKKDNEEFNKVRYIMHVLKPIYPDPDKSVRDNSIEMMNKDYEQKVNAYERAYGKKLTYEFEDGDIAGWRG